MKSSISLQLGNADLSPDVSAVHLSILVFLLLLLFFVLLSNSFSSLVFPSLSSSYERFLYQLTPRCLLSLLPLRHLLSPISLSFCLSISSFLSFSLNLSVCSSLSSCLSLHLPLCRSLCIQLHLSVCLSSSLSLFSSLLFSPLSFCLIETLTSSYSFGRWWSRWNRRQSSRK